MGINRRDLIAGGVALTSAAIFGTTTARAQPGLNIRRNVYELEQQASPIISAYATAVDTMMRRPLSDPTSWWFQANIHDYPDDDTTFVDEASKPHFRKCPHSNYLFLPWHRLYLYYFERIVRAASGDSSFALPYWSYETPQQSTLPVSFRWQDEDPENPTPPLARSNPLARASRFVLVDIGAMALGDTAYSSAAAFARHSFLPVGSGSSFGGAPTTDPLVGSAPGVIEQQPHNIAHGVVGVGGGDMSTPRLAARDPIFWLHHAHIDGLWQKWLAADTRHTNPIDDCDWMGFEFTFFDENGDEQTHTVADAVDPHGLLGYQYDFETNVAAGAVACVAIPPSPLDIDEVRLGGNAAPGLDAEPIELGASQHTVGVRLDDAGLSSLARDREPGAPARQYFLVLNGIASPDGFEGFYEVYLQPLDTEGTPRGSESLVGTLAFFGLGHAGHHGAGVNYSFDITEQLAALGNDAPRVDVRFELQGGVLEGGSYIPANTVRPTIASISVISQAE